MSSITHGQAIKICPASLGPHAACRLPIFKNLRKLCLKDRRLLRWHLLWTVTNTKSQVATLISTALSSFRCYSLSFSFRKHRSKPRPSKISSRPERDRNFRASQTFRDQNVRNSRLHPCPSPREDFPLSKLGDKKRYHLSDPRRGYWSRRPKQIRASAQKISYRITRLQTAHDDLISLSSRFGFVIA